MTSKSRPSRSYDVVIVGAGPAGCAAGLTLLKRAGVRVAMIDRGRTSSWKVGESLSPGVRPLLDYLQLWSRYRDGGSLVSFGSEAAWGTDQLTGFNFLFTPHGNGWGLDRSRFESLLLNAFRERDGVVLQPGRVIGVEREGPGRMVLSAEVDGQPCSLRAKFLIDAGGRNGMLCRKMQGTRVGFDDLVGVAALMDLPVNSVVAQVTQVEAVPYGWWYSAPIPDGRLAVVLMTDADIAANLKARHPQRWLELLKRTRHVRQRAAGADFCEMPRVVSARSTLLQQPSGEDWVAVGDAVASHDPLSSSGIPHAMGSGIHGTLVAADALFANGELARVYAEHIHGDFRQYMQSRRRHYLQVSRWADHLFWKRRCDTIRLDPAAKFESISEASADLASVHLAKPRLNELLKVCCVGQPVHEAARSFVDAFPGVPDEKVILALQDLVFSGHAVVRNTIR
ncbi:NAD(P)/FAD-dependent oxidoreductase [Rhodopirellula sp. SWK7]|uniref:NAD(P)/FAD-dependent oxidoreductase n=1 Tax=Rhodopirellula sp. SWK7 TaxID=595460 RepID=UPI0005C5F695|nr:tryptophan 7-halogenase [Rhodopirellula sp. SWK7]